MLVCAQQLPDAACPQDTLGQVSHSTVDRPRGGLFIVVAAAKISPPPAARGAYHECDYVLVSLGVNENEILVLISETGATL